MKKILFSLALLWSSLVVGQQTIPSVKGDIQPVELKDSAQVKSESTTKKHQRHRKFIQAADTLSKSDYMMSIDRVNDHLNDIRDSVKLGFDVLRMSRDLVTISADFNRIQQDFKDRRSYVNIKNLYLYQSFAADLDKKNDWIVSRLNFLFKRVSSSKYRLKKVLTDTVFRKLYADSTLRSQFDNKLIRLERKWARTDSTSKANIDSLNQMKIRAIDNSMNLTNMLNRIDTRLDRADQRIFGKEISYLWQVDSLATDSVKGSASIFKNEKKALSYYVEQTSSQRILIIVLGMILFLWLFLKRKTLKIIHQQSDKFGFLRLKFLNTHPVLSLLASLLCLMPLFDAYAPTSYIAIEYCMLLIIASVVLYPKFQRTRRLIWGSLLVLFVADVVSYLLFEPTVATRFWMLLIHGLLLATGVWTIVKTDQQTPYRIWIKISAFVCVLLALLGILSNIFGRISLSGVFGVAASFSISQMIVLTIFVETFIELVLVQLVSSRLKKGVEHPFDASVVANKIRTPMLLIAAFLWIIMLTSNLNVFHSISLLTVDALTKTRTIGSISFQLTSIFLFFIIIWIAHVLQRLVGFLFGETGLDNEDITSASKSQHSRLLITRLLVLVGGYLLAIIVSGLPVDKLTFLLGALGVGIGMGLQNVVNNFVSGIILIFDGSLKIGDEIEVNGQSGKVKEIGLRASTLNTADGADVIIPNGNILSQNIVNWTFTNDQKRVTVDFTLTGEELDANVINDVINKTIKEIPNVISTRNPVILFTKVTVDKCSITVRFWSNIAGSDQVKSNVILSLNKAFAEKKIGFK